MPDPYANVVGLPATTTFTSEQALLSALEFARADNLQRALVIGIDGNGDLLVRSSRMNCEDANWLIDKAKLYILNGGT